MHLSTFFRQLHDNQMELLAITERIIIRRVQIESDDPFFDGQKDNLKPAVTKPLLTHYKKDAILGQFY